MEMLKPRMSNSNLGRVLVVDDKIDLKDILVESLTQHGYEALGFSSGIAALEALRHEAFDVLVTDLMMPEMDGITLLRSSLEIDPLLICIVMTGQGTIETAVDAMKLGAFDYLLKPFRVKTILPILARAMSARQLKLENLQLRETVAIHELSQTIASTLDQQTVLNKLADASLQQADADEVSILLPSNDNDDLYVAAVRGENQQRLLGRRVPTEKSISGFVARQRTPLILDGEVNDERFEALWPRPEIRSALCVPMQVANKLIGVININSLHRTRAFSLGQMKALTILASTAATAIESASLYEQVQKAEANYRSIFENAVEGMFQSTLDHRFITVNPSLARILGYDSPAEVIQTVTNTFRQLYVDRDLAAEVIDRLNESGIVRRLEFESYRKNGEKIWLSLNIRLVRDAEGNPLYREGSIEDISLRKRNEAELLYQKSLLESQTEAAIDGVFVVSPDHKILSFNQRFLEMWGLNTDLIRGDATKAEAVILEHLTNPEESMSRVKHLYEHPGESSNDEIELTDGRTIERYSAPVRGPHGEGYGRVWFFRDISDRKLAQAELTRLAAAVEQTGDSVVITDIEGNIEYVNPTFERITGYTRDEVLGENPRILKSGKNDPAIFEELWQTISRGDVWVGQLINRKKDGSLFYERATISAVHDASGKTVNYVAVKQDTTNENQLQEQLRQSQKLEAIGQLAGGVAHDFNNLLTVIGGYSELLLRRLPEDSQLRVNVSEIKKASDRASNLTRQLLAFSRKQILQPKVLDLNSLVWDLDKMLRRLIGEDIDLFTITEPTPAMVRADPGQIDQVIMNLIVNARDAMTNGGKITIRTENITLNEEQCQQLVSCVPGNYVLLKVSDNGSGMNEETMNRVFEPFFTTKAGGKGTGLGLSTVYGIVRQSGGQISVESEVGAGTAFSIYLPTVEATQENEPGSTEVNPVAGSETILLVEDEEQVRIIAQEVLETMGYSVLSAANGEQALEIVKGYDGPIHLAITDVVMPQMGGRELIDRLMPLRPNIRVIYMSGYTDDAIMRHSLLDEKVQFIQKPFAAYALARKVRQVLDPPARNGK
jgi:PAS domain S-box-containing protein